MKNKILISLSLFLAILLVGTLFLFSLDTFYKTTFFPKLTIDETLSDEKYITELGIGELTSPEKLGLAVKTIQFESFDGTKLGAWFIPSKDSSSNQCIIFCHDRHSNRLEGMKFLDAFKKAGLLDKYSILLPDLRNSGVSEDAKTFIGYKFSEDIITGATVVKSQFGISNFVFFGTGMGATAAAISMRRADMVNHLNSMDIHVEGLILDSPISNVKTYITRNNKDIFYPLVAGSLFLFNRNVEGYMDYMKLSFLIKKTDYPVIILQNIGDETTPTDVLLAELQEIPDIQLELFDGVEHAGMILHPGYKNRYIELIKTFLK
ncbi:alpha/beta hydrolase family protein [Chondrinema litorale]|uniref:alpha/beta hydrolase family protein n=1 Tax=Chondrinema litorale TaxID=2994555 RepID=UPI002543ABD1|nr:hypothetical protein [Chondrinema litorale]UZR92948.1 hypothetical protein OQ292_13885 [Chondrinema litorale]